MDSYKSNVYFLVLGDGTAFKIGKSSDPIKRIAGLQNYYKFDLERSFLYECSCSEESFEIEQILHKIFKNKRISFNYDGGTEFFDIVVFGSVCNIMENIADERGLLKKRIYINESLECGLNHYNSIVPVMMKKVTDAIRLKRLSLNMSQKELSIISKVSKKTIERIERGDNSTFENILTLLVSVGMEDVINIGYIEQTNKQRAVKNGFCIINGD